MRTAWKWSWPLAALVALVSPARSAEQEKTVPEAGAVRVMLLRQESVRDELKLTKDETEKVHTFIDKQWKKAQEIEELKPEERETKFAAMAKENEQFLKEVLEPREIERLDQITMQVAGMLWVTQPEVASKLQLTEAQKTKAKGLQLEARKEMQELIHSATREGKQEKLRELRATSRKRLMELLTDEQEAKWKQLAGAPFEGRLRFGE